jgi:hypothetical protein
VIAQWGYYWFSFRVFHFSSLSPESPMQSTVKLFAVVSLVSAVACNRDQTAADAQRNLDLANQQAAAPQLADTPRVLPPAPAMTAPKAAAPKAASPRPVAAAPAPAAPKVIGTMPAGTTLSLRSDRKVCTNTNTAGEIFTASVSESVSGENGARISSGSVVSLGITKLARKTNATNEVVMDLEPRSIVVAGKRYELSGGNVNPTVSKIRMDSRTDDITKVAAGAAIGAAAGAIIGKNTRGAIIGAAAGTAAGVGAAATISNYEGCIDAGAPIRLTLGNTLVLN